MRISLAISLLIGASVTTATDNSACNSGQLGQLVSLLRNYTPATSYCAGLLPSRTPTTTTTITQCEPKATRQTKRDDSTNIHDASSSQTKAFMKLRRSKQVSYEVCACMNNAPAPQTVHITTTCPSNQHCTSQGICAPKRNCKNPARCESDSYCLETATGACFCHPDVEDSTMGYCMSSGPFAANGCPDIFEDCARNADCGGGGGGGSRVCIYACCREQPFCVDLYDYDPDATRYAVLERLGRRVDRDGFNPRW